MSAAKEYEHGYDTFFETKETLIGAIEETSFVAELKESSKPGDEDLEKMNDQVLDDINSETGIEPKDIELNWFDIFEKSLHLTAKVIKNTEDIEDGELKLETYKDLLVCSVAYTCLYKIFINHCFENNDYLQSEIGKQLQVMIRFLPLGTQSLMYNIVGSGKLEIVMAETIEAILKDDQSSDLEKFFSVFIYSDQKGKDFLKYIKNLIRSTKKSFVLDFILLKLVSYYMLRSRSVESDNEYLNVIADLYQKARPSEQPKHVIIDHYKSKKSSKKQELLEDSVLSNSNEKAI